MPARWMFGSARRAAVTVGVTTVAAVAASLTLAGNAAGQPASGVAPSAAADVHAQEWTSPAAARVAARLDAQADTLIRLGVWGWAQDPRSPSKLDVWLIHYSRQTAAAVSRVVGRDALVAHGSRAPIRALDRYHDTPPYYGGDRIVVPAGQCTSGPTVYGNAHNTPYMLTAGHCANVGDAIKTPGGTVMGHVTNKRLCNHCIDDETVNGSYARYIWTGPTSVVYEDHGAPPTNGQHLTIDGSFSGQVRQNTVTNANTTVLINYGGGVQRYIRYVFVTRSPSGQIGCQPGDSGAPVYTYPSSGTRVTVNGVLIAGTGTAGGTCVAVRIDAIENWFHVHIA